MAELPAYHARTHLFGGTDPLPMQLPWAYGIRQTGQAVTSAEELEFEVFMTNAPTCFALDQDSTANPSGILIYESGLFLTAAMMDNGSDTVGFYTQIQPASNYPMFGSEFGWGSLSGPFAWDTSLINSAQPRQNHFAIGRAFGTPADPWRAIAAIVGTTSLTSLSTHGLVIIKIGGMNTFSVSA